MSDRLYRTTFIDYGTRRRPKTNRSCVRCQLDIRPDSPARVVHITDECLAIHPDDEEKYRQAGSPNDNGLWLLGMNCAKRVGLEWTRDE